jgi:hypothetical protein
LVASACVFVAGGDALAIGMCEDLEHEYDLTAVSQKNKQILVQGTIEWCEEGDDGEKRGELEYAQARTFDGKVVHTWLAKVDAKSLARYRERIEVATKPRALKALEGYRRSGGFVEEDTLAKSPSKGCSVAVEAKERAEVKGEFQKADATVKLAQGATELWVKKGEFDVDAGKVVKVLFLPASKSVVAWIDLRTCEGPPPGHFGEDDGGSCQKKPGVAVVHLTEANANGVAACF